jgi:hypothetical protein
MTELKFIQQLLDFAPFRFFNDPAVYRYFHLVELNVHP